MVLISRKVVAMSREAAEGLEGAINAHLMTVDHRDYSLSVERKTMKKGQKIKRGGWFKWLVNRRNPEFFPVTEQRYIVDVIYDVNMESVDAIDDAIVSGPYDMRERCFVEGFVQVASGDPSMFSLIDSPNSLTAENTERQHRYQTFASDANVRIEELGLQSEGIEFQWAYHSFWKKWGPSLTGVVNGAYESLKKFRTELAGDLSSHAIENTYVRLRYRRISNELAGYSGPAQIADGESTTLPAADLRIEPGERTALPSPE